VIDAYDANLRRYDRRVGRLLATLRRTGLDRRTVVVLVSNHGEDLFLHAYADHGQLYDTVLRIPLVIADPAAPDPGRVVSAVVQSVDVAPTILARAGAAPAVRMVGQSLLPHLGLAEGRVPDRPVFSLTDGCNASLRTNGWKLLVRDDDPRVDWHGLVEAGGVEAPERVDLRTFLDAHTVTDLTLPSCADDPTVRRNAGAQPMATGGITASSVRSGLYVELFDLAADPRESVNLARQRPEVAVPLVRDLLVWLAARRAAGDAAAREPLTDAQVRRLREQGYWGFVQPPPDASREREEPRPSGYPVPSTSPGVP
jgi:hypothetical protein